MLRTSLPGQVRQTNLPKWKPLLPLFEAVMNAYQAIQETINPAGRRIIVNVHREPLLALGIAPRVTGFTVVDEGVGFTDDNMDSFNTAYSEYKYARGGKGLGRFLWLKAFAQVKVDSVFQDTPETGALVARSFVFNSTYDPDSVSVTATPLQKTGTSITLAGFLEPFKSAAPTDLDHIARRMCEHFILLLMRPGCPLIELRDGRTTVNVNSTFDQTFRQASKQRAFTIGGHEFVVHGFRLRQPRSSRHRLTYCADDRAVVSENLEEYIPNLTSRLTEEDSTTFVYLAVVTGAYLDARVNNARTSFEMADDIDVDADQALLPIEEVKRSEIRSQCLEFVQEDLAATLADINTSKLQRIADYVDSDAPHYRILLRRAGEFIDNIPPSASKVDLEAALHRELHKREVELKREGGRIIIEAAKLDDYDAYRDRLASFMSNYNELGVAALAQYVLHRRIILDFFERALSVDNADGKYPLEKVLHQILFPMRSSSEDVLLSQQNLWILDERLNYHQFVHSDQRLGAIDALSSTSALRPDLLVFDREFPMSDGVQPLTSLTVVEFKRPMRNDYTDDSNPLDQVVRTVEEIRSGKSVSANGRPISVAGPDIPTNCYIVCDITERLRKQLKDWEATLTPDGQGYYGYHRNHRIYYEVMDYNKVLRDAQRRNRAMFDRLNLL